MRRWMRFLAAPFGRPARQDGREETGLRGYDLEQEARDGIARVRSHTMLRYERMVTLYQQAVFCEQAGLPGSFVECGTWKGGAVGLMALANLKYGGARRPLHLFDSFEGIPEPDAAVDGEEALRFSRNAGGGTGGRLVPLAGTYESVGTLEVNRELLERTLGYDPAYLFYHPGWFQETLPGSAAQVGPVAILRLDGDWYASTRVCLEHLYDSVVPGGFVIVDDYGLYEGCRTAVNEFRQERGIAAYLNHIDAEGRYWIKP